MGNTFSGNVKIVDCQIPEFEDGEPDMQCDISYSTMGNGDDPREDLQEILTENHESILELVEKSDRLRASIAEHAMTYKVFPAMSSDIKEFCQETNFSDAKIIDFLKDLKTQGLVKDI